MAMSLIVNIAAPVCVIIASYIMRMNVIFPFAYAMKFKPTKTHGHSSVSESSETASRNRGTLSSRLTFTTNAELHLYVVSRFQKQ